MLRITFDFLTGSSDAYQHFCPISQWVFASPVSYWESGKFSEILPPLNTLAVAIGSAVWYRRMHRTSSRITLLVIAGGWVALSMLMLFVGFGG